MLGLLLSCEAAPRKAAEAVTTVAAEEAPGILSEKGFKRAKDCDGQSWKECNFHFKVVLKYACPQFFQLVTKMERAESEDAMVEMATPEATSMSDGDLEEMATDVFDTTGDDGER